MERHRGPETSGAGAGLPHFEIWIMRPSRGRVAWCARFKAPGQGSSRRTPPSCSTSACSHRRSVHKPGGCSHRLSQ